ncbi:MAG: hypothetical protein II800_07605 [Lachnospiraceae bacterium]|nr:hypothetical protein [Lachnospiraceae bacterium]
MAEQVTSYKCPACEGPLRFDGKTQKLKCDYCDGLYTVEEVEKLLAEKTAKAEAAREKEDARIEHANAEAAAYGGEMETNTYVCTSCGAALDTDATTAVTSCPYCGNPTAIAGQMSKAVKPDYCIPFRLEKKDAIAALKNYYNGKKLLPKSFTENNHLEEIQGVYVPFWLFSGTAHADVKFEGRDRKTHRSKGPDLARKLGLTKADIDGFRLTPQQWNNEVEVEEVQVYDVRRKGDVSFHRVPADGSTKMPDDLMDSIEPFDYKDLKPFSMAYMPGFLANRYDVDKDEVKTRVTERAENTAVDEMRASVSHGEISEKERKVDVAVDKTEYVLFPVWMLSTKWEGQNFLFAMNGQTGKMIGNLPIDKGKATAYFLGITAALSIVFSLIAMYFV